MLAGFSEKDAADKSKRMWIRRRLPGKTDSISTAASFLPPSNVSIANNSSGTATSSITNGTFLTTQSSPFSPTDSPGGVIPKPRATATAKQLLRRSKMKAKKKYNHIFKKATSLYKAEKGNGMSASTVSDLFLEKYKIKICPRKIQRYVKKNVTGVSPIRRGPQGNINPLVYKNLCMAFESYLRINQINARIGKNSRPKLAIQVNKAAGIVSNGNKQSAKLLDRILRDTAIDLNASKCNFAEDRRIQWTTKKNLSVWFDNWGNDLVELGFATRDASDSVVIPEEQLKNIVNFDETCLSLDGSEGNRGGRPVVVFYDPRFPQVGKGTSKSALTTTMITGSTAAGEALPPHFQFQTAAQTVERERIRRDCVAFMLGTKGKFGGDEEKVWPATYGLNEKGGMDTEEFEKYIKNSIIPLFPNARDEPGKRVLLKCDSGPGRMNIQLLAYLRLLGFILYPGVPNTTAVTQETDRNYGKFKSQFRTNLELVVEQRVENNESVSLQPWLVGLFVFGGTDPVTGCELEKSAFQEGFSREECKRAWEKVGAAPLTRKCLEDDKVLKSVGDGDDAFNQLLLSIQDANDLSTHALTEAGFGGEFLKVAMVKVNGPKIITEKHTVERQRAMSKAKTSGKMFHTCGGFHMTSDDMFKSTELEVREKEVADMKKDKDRRLQLAKIEQAGHAVLAKNKDVASLTVTELESLLNWYQAPKVKGALKADKLEQWKQILESGNEPPPFEKWTDEDDSMLHYLETKEIELGDTAYGRLLALKEREFGATLRTMSKAKRDELRMQLDAMDEGDIMNDDDVPTPQVGEV